MSVQQQVDAVQEGTGREYADLALLIDGAWVGADDRVTVDVVNTARGGLVRSPDLEEVLTERPDLQAVLDVTDPEPLPPDSPLLTLPNVLVTPHIAGSLGRRCRRMGALVVEEPRRLTAGGPLQHAVDLGRLHLAATP